MAKYNGKKAKSESEKESEKLFLIYIKRYITVIFVFFLFSIIFIVSFMLYRLPVEACIYPAMLCIAAGILFLIYNFFKMLKKHRLLEKTKTLSSAMITELPPVEGIDDFDYQEIIASLRQEQSDYLSISEMKYNEMIDYYTAWAHQIKTPIASMHLALENEDSSLSRRLSSELFHIEQYVEMVLAFLRLDSEYTDYVFKEYNIDDIIRSSVRKFAGDFIIKKISLEYETTNATAITDEKWLSFVVEQIISNALKYTPGGNIKIYVSDGKTLCIKDNGIGIAPEDLPRIFEKGYTGYNGRADRKASGLGLYLCKKICRNLNIPIEIESAPGIGTLVKIGLEQYELKAE